jgi:hypothetical protein
MDSMAEDFTRRMSMTEDNMRIDTMVLGRKIGTHAGYDIADDFVEVFIDFDPVYTHLPFGELTVDYGCGLFMQYNDTGDLVWEADIVSVLQDIEPETK